MSQIIAVSNQKGGVAKTTTTLHLAAAFARAGERVLMLDLDPQGSLSLHCGLAPDELAHSIYDILMKSTPPAQVLRRASFGADILPANLDLSMAEMELVNVVARERRLGAALAPLRDAYDYVLIDCQPSMGLLTLNALAVADWVLIPVSCEFLSLRGVDVLLKMMGKVRLRLNSKLRVLGLLPTMFDTRTNHAHHSLAAIKTHFGSRYRVFDAVIGRSIRFPEAAEAAVPIYESAPKSPGSESYQQAAAEILAALQAGAATPG